MMLTHRQAALFSARRLELCDVVESTLVYLRPDSRVHSYLSPLPYQVKVFSNYPASHIHLPVMTRIFC